MAIVKTDASQTKTAVALIGILVVAVGATIMRINPGSEPSPAAKTEQGASSSPAVKITQRAYYLPARNPFERPAALTAGLSMAGKPLSRGGRGRVSVKRWSEGDGPEIAPMPVGGGLEVVSSQKPVPDKPDAPDSSIQAKPRPSFILLATIKSGNGFSAVIGTGGSDSRVVETGDVLEGGFKVTKLEADRAILSDGRNIIVAKRPEP